MSRLRPKELRALNEEELQKKLLELGAELAKLRSSAARGTIRKESGRIRAVRRDVARILTVVTAKRTGAVQETRR